MQRRTFNPVFWALANVGSRVRYVPGIAESLTTATLPAETSLTIPTRHGTLRAVLVRTAPSRSASGALPPDLTSQALGPLYLGGMSAANLAAAGRIRTTDYGAIARLGQLLRTDPEPHNTFGF